MIDSRLAGKNNIFRAPVRVSQGPAAGVKIANPIFIPAASTSNQLATVLETLGVPR